MQRWADGLLVTGMECTLPMAAMPCSGALEQHWLCCLEKVV